MRPCARNCGRPAAPGRTRCDECAAKDRAENGGRYVKRGGHGGARKCPPGCTCLRHGSLARGSVPTVEHEGSVTRIQCRVCQRVIAGTFDAEQVAEIVARHVHARRLEKRRAQRELAA